MRSVQIFLTIFLLNVVLIKSEQQWTYDLISINSNTSDPTMADVKLNVIKIARGQYAFEGFLDLKIDLNDDTIVSLQIYRSTTGLDEDFKQTPFRVDGESLATFMNTHYINAIIITARECATNIPEFEKFTPPLTKRRVDLENCNVPLDGYPDQMSEGKYKIAGSVKTPLFSLHLEIIIYIEEL